MPSNFTRDYCTGSEAVVSHSQGSQKKSSQGSQKNSSQGSRKNSSQGSRKISKQGSRKISSQGTEKNSSQGSQKNSSGSNGSIKSYFSPTRKKTASSRKLLKKYSSEDFDPVLKLLIASDSDSDAGVVEDFDERKKTEDDGGYDAGDWEGERTRLSESEAEELSGNEDVDQRKMDTDSENPGGGGGGGFMQELLDQEAVLSDNLGTDLTENAESVSADVSCSDRSAGGHQNPPITNPANPSAPVTAFSVQKQTSLFSFFKPHCHSAQKQHLHNGAKAVSKPSFPQQGSGKNINISSTAATKPALGKSASEPVRMLRVPSPPPLVQVKNVHPAGSSKPPPSRGRPSIPSASTSWQTRSGRQCPFYKKLPGMRVSLPL